MQSFILYVESATPEQFFSEPTRENYQAFADSLSNPRKLALLALLTGQQAPRATRNTDDPGWLAWWFDSEMGSQLKSEQFPAGTTNFTRMKNYADNAWASYQKAMRDYASDQRRRERLRFRGEESEEIEEPVPPFDPDDDADLLGQLSFQHGATLILMRERQLVFAGGSWFTFEVQDDPHLRGIRSAWKQDRPGNENMMTAIVVHLARKNGIVTVPRAEVVSWKGRFGS